ncbi:MAG: DegV family protein [Anaerolineae bacterium]|nr:DegV family protein [Anaerolineae bacterium]MDW8101064.1 DegV family protein [Anaerolineae bacterium]
MKLASIAIVTDSNALLSPKAREQYGIEVVPLLIHIGGRTYQEGVNLTTEQFFRFLEQSDELPSASAPSVQTFANVYERLCRTHDQVLSIHLSSKMNDAFAHAQLAAQRLLGRCRIQVVDSLSTSLGLGLLVEVAAREVQAGRPLDAIVRLIRGMIPHLYAVFFVETLEYLERARRIGHAQAILGTMLGIKPLLMIEEGEIIPLEKVRTRARAVDKLFEFICEFTRIEQMAILQHGFSEETAILLERLETVFPDREFPVYTCNPSLAVHLGPSAMGVIVYEGLR